MKKILIIVSLVAGIVAIILLQNRLPEIKLRQEINERNEELGPFVIEEEFLGPNINSTKYIDNINPDEIKF